TLHEDLRARWNGSKGRRSPGTDGADRGPEHSLMRSEGHDLRASKPVPVAVASSRPIVARESEVQRRRLLPVRERPAQDDQQDAYEQQSCRAPAPIHTEGPSRAGVRRAAASTAAIPTVK